MNATTRVLLDDAAAARRTVARVCDADHHSARNLGRKIPVTTLVELHERAERASYMALMHDLTVETAVQTYECPCGEETHPLYEPADGDVTTWCMCGLRIADTRAIALRLIEQAAAAH